MKNLILLLLLAAPLALLAQNKNIESFYNKYMNQQNVTNINLEGWILNMASEYIDEDSGEAFLKDVSKLRIMVMEDGNLVKPDEYNGLISSLRSDNFEELMTVRDGETKVNLYAQQKDGIISNAVMMVNEPDEFVLLSLEGAIKLEDLQNLNFSIDNLKGKAGENGDKLD
jgi:uncharacterized protein YjiK